MRELLYERHAIRAFEFLPWQVGCPIEADAWDESRLRGFANEREDVRSQLIDEGFGIGEELLRLRDPCLLYIGELAPSCGVETSGGATFRCVWTDVAARNLVGRKIQDACEVA